MIFTFTGKRPREMSPGESEGKETKKIKLDQKVKPSLPRNQLYKVRLHLKFASHPLPLEFQILS